MQSAAWVNTSKIEWRTERSLEIWCQTRSSANEIFQNKAAQKLTREIPKVINETILLS